MKSMKKRMGAIIASATIATAFAAVGTVLLIKNNAVAVAEESNAATEYFYDKLGTDENAKKFYETFKKLADDGTLKTGKLEYNLVENDVVAISDVAAFVNSGDTRLIKAYGAGRDAFILDNPDLFYVDLFGTSVNAGTKGKDYVAFLDSSMVTSLYIGELNSAEEINSAIAVYESKLGEIVTAAKTKSTVKEQIEYVNEYIATHVEYSYGTEVVDGRNVDTPAAAYINTSYGALVNGKAICGGYSKAFKAVMDRLDIPCVCVQGYSLLNGRENAREHMWNYVNIEGMWYAVDVTWNSTNGKTDKWLLLGANNFEGSHLEDNVISSSGYELQFPAIKPYDYGSDSDENGMEIEGTYRDSSDNTGKILTLSVSYDGKGALKLQEEGKYLAFRMSISVDNGVIDWGPYWFSAVEYCQVYSPVWSFEDTESKLDIYANSRYTQFALINRAPDESLGSTFPDYHENAGQPYNYAYKTDNLTSNDFASSPSAPYENDGYGSYVPAPWGNPNPTNTGDLPVDKTYSIRITYTESLEKINAGEDIELNITSSTGNDSLMQNIEITDLQWDGDKVITFNLTPSRMYIHNLADYYIVPTNLQGVKSKKVPEPVRYCFKGKSVICSKVFNDGRLYMSVYGGVQMLDTSDLSVTDFKDENGNYYAASQRSQLMLVASKADEGRVSELESTLIGGETNLKKEDIVASTTYEINLQICGVVQKVPNGSYMQVAFGFPEGYDPDDAGTTFKIYHYKHDDSGNITGVEEIPVIITQYGLIAKVNSFSPFTIVQVKNDSDAVKAGSKAVYASATGKGSIQTNGQSGISLVEGSSITYTLKAEEGYQVAYVRLNGKAIDPSRYSKGTLTLSAEELENGNTLEAGFITQEAVNSYAKMGVDMVGIDTKPVDADKNSNTLWIVLGCVLGAIVVGCGVATGIIIYKKKKMSN